MDGKDVRVIVTVIKDGVCVADMAVQVSGGRHELTFSHPIKVNGRHFEGFALEMWIDQEARRVDYKEFVVSRPDIEMKR